MTEAPGAPGVPYTKELPAHYRRDYDHILEVDEWNCPSDILPQSISGQCKSGQSKGTVVERAVRPAGWYEFHSMLGGSTFVHHKQAGVVTVLREFDNDLSIDWMTDDPIPWHTQRMYAARVDPNRPVLVGGLGLGLFLKHLPKMRANVVVVERSREVIDLVWKHVSADRMLIVPGDFFGLPWLPKGEDFGTVLTDFWTGPPWDHGLHDMFVKTYNFINQHWPKAQQFYPRMDALLPYMKREKTEDAQRAMLHRMIQKPANA
jgi:hypothetical protein